MVDDLELKDLAQFYGTLSYHKGYMGVDCTDGVAYISNNGYSWFVTDSISVLKMELNDKDKYPFLVVKLATDLENHTAVMTIEDGNDNILYTQKYSWTSSMVEKLVLYYIDNVMMLSSEY